MSTRLSRKLNETELLLNIARMTGATPDRKSAVASIVRLIAVKLDHGSCSFYALQSEQKSFYLESSNDPNHGIHGRRIALDNSLLKQMFATNEPLRIHSFGELMRGDSPPEMDGSGLVMPVTRDDRSIGLLIIMNQKEYLIAVGPHKVQKGGATLADGLSSSTTRTASASRS